jgi:hypothetical protein
MVWETASFIPSMGEGGGHGPGSTPYTPIHTGLKDTLDMAHWARVAGELKELGKYVHKPKEASVTYSGRTKYSAFCSKLFYFVEFYFRPQMH